MNDDELRRLLSDAVSQVEPADRLEQIRASVHPDPQVVPMSRPRPWLYAAIGVAATVAVIGGVAFATGALPGGDKADDSGPVGPVPTGHHSTAPVTPPTSSAPSTPTSSGTTAPSGTQAYAVYYVGDNPAGKPVLFREFHTGQRLSGPAAANQALNAVSQQPYDADYSTQWPVAFFSDPKANPTAKAIFVTVADSSLRDRPLGMNRADAKASIQQVVYTLQAAFQTRLPVHFLYHATNGYNPADRLLGLPVSQGVAQGNVLDTLSLINISNPNEGDQVSGQLTVAGVNNSFEGSSVIYLERNGKKYLTTPVIGGSGPDKLYPWTTSLAVSKLQPGQYTLVAQNDDPSGQGHPEVDTRMVIVK